MITDEQYYNSYDRSHFLLGLSVVTIPEMFNVSILYIAILSVTFVVWALWKEFYWDMDDSNETPEVSGGLKGGFRDWIYYIGGLALGWGLVAIKIMMSQKV